MRRLSRRAVIGSSVAAVAVIGGGAAFAFWATGAQGTANATTGGGASLAITNLATTDGPMNLGSTQHWHFNLVNNGDQQAAIDEPGSNIAIDPAWSSTAKVPNKPACTAGDFTVSPHQYWGIPGSLAGHGSTTVSFDVTLNNNPNADQENCKNLTNIPVKIDIH